MNSKPYKIGAVVITLLFIGSALLIPMGGAGILNVNNNVTRKIVERILDFPEDEKYDQQGQRYDTNYYPEEEPQLLAEYQNDMGYNKDMGNQLKRSLYLYVGEAIDNAPGRTRTGYLNPGDNDDSDFYMFAVFEGQTINVDFNGEESYMKYQMYAYNPGVDDEEWSFEDGHVATYTGFHFIEIYADEPPQGAGLAEYYVDVILTGQDDANSNGDAGNTINQAKSISPGTHEGYMDMNDPADFYSFNANSGDGITVSIESFELKCGDFDITLYNPEDEMVHRAMYYGDDVLEYPADSSGTWKIKIDLFPGWDEEKWPDDYFLYGSGPYTFELSVGASVEAPPGPIPQPEINPVAQTFVVNNQADNNKDEYAYLAAVPAANYFKDGQRYLSPIVYQGDDTQTNWFGTVDDTTQYLIDDWETYLADFEKTPTVYNLDTDPVKAAADIATARWTSSNTAVVAVDGSDFEDSVEKVLEKTSNLNTQTSVETLSSEDEKLNSDLGYTMLLGKKWGAIGLQLINYDGRADGSGPPSTLITSIFPSFLDYRNDWWPTPYDGAGDATDTYFPVTKPGLYSATTTLSSGDYESYKIIKVPGDRYTIPVSSTDSSLKVTVTSSEETALRIYLVDPDGNIRRPAVPHWNGGDVNPIHQWNGGHWQHDQEEFRSWVPEVSKTHTQEIYYPMTGKWTVIVVPASLEYADQTYSYDIVGEIITHSSKRTNAALSAANAAVIASQENAPLLYVKEDSVPAETQSALTALGANNIIFVNIGGVSSADVSSDVEYTTLQQTVDAIKGYSHTENYITITSLGSGDGFFAPASMAAAYHCSPVLNLGEASEVYNTLDMLAAYREYSGDYYHGCNAVGHPPKMSEPTELENPPSLIDLLLYYFQNDQTLPPIGLDLHMYSYRIIHDGVVSLIDSYGLQENGKEAYLFVASRERDIRNIICRAMTGIESYAGHIPEDTPSFASAHIVRDLLYPALIYANPGKDVTSSCMFNFADGRDWTTNDGERTYVYTSRNMKRSMSSHGRFYEGHTIWSALLERYNAGASVLYHCSHGTGGSGICCMYENIQEQFPYAEPRNTELKDFTWWDAWRGYMYDDSQVKSPRWGGFTWSNSQEPNLYDIVHFKWCDQLFDNLHSQFNLWQSCTTGEHFGPIIYLEHGAAVWYGNAETGLCPQEELFDDWWFTDMMENGLPIGESLSNWVWYHQRDYTAQPGSTEYELSMYGSSSMGIDNAQVLYGDPAMYCYSPEWTEPVPVDA